MAVGNKGGGRPPKPTQLHVLHGTYRPVEHDKRRATVYPDGLPSPPSHLNAAAKKVYLQYGTLMVNARVLTEADAMTLALFAESCSNWFHASRLEQQERKRQEAIEAAWDSDEHEDDYERLEKRLRRLEQNTKESVWYKRSVEERKLVDKFGSMLGLSPVMRAKVTPVEKPEPADPMAELLGL